MSSQPQATAYLIDASIYIFRAWFSVPDSMRGDDGSPVNAAYGFCKFLTEFVERSNATHVAVAFDESLTTSFRNDVYPQYKMNRELPPQGLKAQFKLCRQAAEAAGLYCVSSDRYEADDLIGTLAKSLREQNFRIGVVSGDKDLAQILQGNDFWWDFARDRQLDHAKVVEKFGVPPEAIQDYLGLCGDAVDNIPGVPGIGPKTAAALLQRYDNMEALYANLDMLRHLQIRGAKTLSAKLAQHKDQAFLSKQLATLAYDAPIDTNAQTLRRQAAEINRLNELSGIMAGRGAGLFERLHSSSKKALALA